MKRFIVAAVAVAACAQAQPQAEDGWQKIAVAVTAAPISDDQGVGASYGALIFRGGVELKSDNPLFGGWSGIEVDRDGRFIAVSDQGSFLSGALKLNAAGDLVGVSDTHLGLMRNEAGAPLDNKDQQDAEDIALLSDGRYAVTFEHDHRILIYDLAKNGPLGAAEKGPRTPQNLASNEGLEALVQAPDGDLIAGREYTDRKSSTDFFKLKLDGSATISGLAQVRDGYALVSLRYLPNGDLIALQRFFFPVIGHRTALRRYKSDGLTAEKPLLDGPELAALQKPLMLDNFEGLAVVAREDGGARLYLISDNNFSRAQRTLLYAFDLPAPKKAKR